LEGKDIVDLKVDKFSSMTNRQRRKAIAKIEANDQKKEAWFQILLCANEKKEVERLAKLVEKEKEKEENAKAKGKKKANDGG